MGEALSANLPRLRRVVPLVLVGLAMLTPCEAKDRDSDKDKRRLFNTFYLNGQKVTWILTLRKNRTYELTGPDGRKHSGNYKASDKAIAFKSIAKGFLRHFNYKYDGNNVKFTGTKKDQPTPGDLLGELPPKGKGAKSTWMSSGNWRKLGRPLTHPSQPKPAVQPPRVTPVVPPPKRMDAPSRIAGTYNHTDVYRRMHTILLKQDGTFELRPPGGKKTVGTYLYLNGELTLNTGLHRRSIKVTNDIKGVRFERRATDVLKLNDALGEMPPQGRAAVLWEPAKGAGSGTSTDTTVADTANTDEPKPLPVIKPPEIPKEEPKKPTPTEKPIPIETIPVEPPKTEKPKQPEVVVPVEKVQPTPPSKTPVSKASIAGHYTYQPNPLVTETLIIKADGTFEYRDSNDAKADGKWNLDGRSLTLTSQDVARHFTVMLQTDGIMHLSREKNDDPKITNDLATMSPSVLKDARYRPVKK